MSKIVATNKRAYHDYHILETLEAGLALKGSEVKSIREGKISLQDAYCYFQNGELYLLQCHIAPYSHQGYEDHDPLRSRKLLLHQDELRKLWKKKQESRYTLIPLKVYWSKNRLKVEIALAKGKKSYDKRQDMAEKESKRMMERIMKQKR
ncbi:MAG: SsrA-binding protein SmpB [Candidatus Marinimicrobia bacterium]|nr:SsrA-binding protein SmpB [Candidatus Neomarinimicrobiota bacterium]MDD5582486.1 SsrA-binding protein SmpB [Candidatus Neomarinimicrobiota bacterium]